MRGRRGATMAFNLIITFIILGVLLLVYFFFIEDSILETSEDATSCEKNGGQCLVVCSSGMTRMPAYKCEAGEDVCCMDLEDVTGIPGTGLECKDVLGECVNASEDCEEGTKESTADCEDDDKKCCVPDENAKNECAEQGGVCMEVCSGGYKENKTYSCTKQENRCCIPN